MRKQTRLGAETSARRRAELNKFSTYFSTGVENFCGEPTDCGKPCGNCGKLFHTFCGKLCGKCGKVGVWKTLGKTLWKNPEGFPQFMWKVLWKKFSTRLVENPVENSNPSVRFHFLFKSGKPCPIGIFQCVPEFKCKGFFRFFSSCFFSSSGFNEFFFKSFRI